MTHACVQLLSSFSCRRLLQLNDLLRKKVLEELIFVANFEELGALSLVVVNHQFKLRQSLFTHSARPVSDLFVGAVRAVAIGRACTLENLGRPPEPLHHVMLVLGWPVKQGQWLG